ncbi:MAG: tetratricopeptide repeat protein [Spirochaetota bacterium]
MKSVLIFKLIASFTIIVSIFFYICPFPGSSDELPEPSWVYKGRGDRYFRSGEYGRAIAEYKKAIIKRAQETNETSPGGGYPEVHFKLAIIYKNEGLLELAMKEILVAENKKEFLQIQDEIYEIMNTKAELYLERGRVSESMATYEQIINMDYNWEDYSKRDFTDITKDELVAFGKNLELRSKYGKAYFSIGELKFLSNNDTAAEPYLKMAFLYNYERKKAKGYLINYYKNTGRSYVVQKIEEYDSILKPVSTIP